MRNLRQHENDQFSCPRHCRGETQMHLHLAQEPIRNQGIKNSCWRQGGATILLGTLGCSPRFVELRPCPETFRSSKFLAQVFGASGEKEGFATRAGPGAPLPPSGLFRPAHHRSNRRGRLSQSPTSGKMTPGRVQKTGAGAPAALRLRHLAMRPRSLGSFI